MKRTPEPDLIAALAESLGVSLVPWRDHNGERGPVPGRFRAHDWQTCRVLRVLSDGWRCGREARVLQLARWEIEAAGGRPVRPPAARRLHEIEVRRGDR